MESKHRGAGSEHWQNANLFLEYMTEIRLILL